MLQTLDNVWLSTGTECLLRASLIIPTMFLYSELLKKFLKNKFMWTDKNMSACISEEFLIALTMVHL